MNKHIELVKKWLNGPDSVSSEELKTNFFSASQDYYAYAIANAGIYDTAWFLEQSASAAAAAAYDSATTTAGVIADSNAAEAANYWVRRYEELSK
tara:strand:- start:323 stop:607 length:285 start_codon:yes stop_codon:yes gene_type:complete